MNLKLIGLAVAVILCVPISCLFFLGRGVEGFAEGMNRTIIAAIHEYQNRSIQPRERG